MLSTHIYNIHVNLFGGLFLGMHQSSKFDLIKKIILNNVNALINRTITFFIYANQPY